MTKKKPTTEEVWLAAHEASRRLLVQGIPHALIGGLAVAVHGYDRATRDADFLVSSEDLSRLTGRPLAIGLTERIEGVRVDYLPIEVADEPPLETAIQDARGDIPVVPISALVYLKIKANRRKDQADVVELVKRGRVPVAETRNYLANLPDPDLVSAFDLLVLESEQEPE